MGKPYKTADILGLPAAERLRLVEQIWDSLATKQGSVPVPDWHRAELDCRLTGEKGALRPWPEVKARLARARRKRASS